MLEVLHELVDAVASLKGITGNKQADLHAKLDQTAEDITGTAGPAGRAMASIMVKPDEPVKADVPAGA